MKILITGIGITGKSTFRKELFIILSQICENVEHFDCDYDRDRLPNNFLRDKVYLIEDVHGPTKNSVFPLETFDQIYYLLPSRLIHFRFWLDRMLIWLKTGRFAWDADKGNKGEWQGNGNPNDWANILPVLKVFWQDWRYRSKWIRDDLNNIHNAGIRSVTIKPKFKNGQIFFTVNL